MEEDKKPVTTSGLSGIGGESGAGGSEEPSLSQQIRNKIKLSVELIQHKARTLHINGIFRGIYYWLFLKRIRRQKLQQIWEGNLDKFFFETKFKNELVYDDSLDRSLLQAERQKPLSDQDPEKIEQIEMRIARAKGIKASYRKTLGFIEEVEAYLHLLEHHE